MKPNRITGKLNHYNELYITIHISFDSPHVYKICNGSNHFTNILKILYHNHENSIQYHLPKNEFDITKKDICNKIIKYLEKNGIITKEQNLELEIDWDSSSQTLHYYINNKIYTAISPIDILQKKLSFINFSEDYYADFSGKKAKEILEILL
jgi:hypothetical protein